MSWDAQEFQDLQMKERDMEDGRVARCLDIKHYDVYLILLIFKNRSFTHNKNPQVFVDYLIQLNPSTL